MWMQCFFACFLQVWHNLQQTGFLPRCVSAKISEADKTKVEWVTLLQPILTWLYLKDKVVSLREPVLDLRRSSVVVWVCCEFLPLLWGFFLSVFFSLNDLSCAYSWRVEKCSFTLLGNQCNVLVMCNCEHANCVKRADRFLSNLVIET